MRFFCSACIEIDERQRLVREDERISSLMPILVWFQVLGGDRFFLEVLGVMLLRKEFLIDGRG